MQGDGGEHCICGEGGPGSECKDLCDGNEWMNNVRRGKSVRNDGRDVRGEGLGSAHIDSEALLRIVAGKLGFYSKDEGQQAQSEREDRTSEMLCSDRFPCHEGSLSCRTRRLRGLNCTFQLACTIVRAVMTRQTEAVTDSVVTAATMA